MLVFAHRGFSGNYPENTMLSFEKAVEAGADGLEMDVHLSKDGRPVVIHDESLLRTTGIDKSVCDYTADELSHINAGKTKEDSFGFTPIPRFEEFCEFWKEKGTTVNVEIKTNSTWYPGIEEIVWGTVKYYHLEEKVIFSSFNWLSIVRMKQLCPYVPCGLLYARINAKNIGAMARSHEIEYCHPDEPLVNSTLVEDCRKNGIGLNVWTINTEQQMSRMIDCDVNSVITNYPDMCLRMLGR